MLLSCVVGRDKGFENIFLIFVMNNLEIFISSSKTEKKTLFKPECEVWSLVLLTEKYGRRDGEWGDIED